MKIEKSNFKEYVEKFKMKVKEGENCFWEMAEIVKEVSEKFGGERNEDRKKVLQKFANEVGFKIQYIYRLWQFAETFPIELRNSKLSLTHYELALRTENPIETIKEVEKKEISTYELQKIIRKNKEKIKKEEKIKSDISDLTIEKVKNAFLLFMGKIGFIKKEEQLKLWNEFYKILEEEMIK